MGSVGQGQDLMIPAFEQPTRREPKIPYLLLVTFVRA